MEQHVITTEQMESMEALSKVNLEISEARNVLFKLQEEETAYLVARERKVMDRIQKTVDESHQLVKEADKNHGQIKLFAGEISNFAQNLLRIQKDFHETLEEFENRNIEWEKDIGRQQDGIANIRKSLKVESVQIENDKKSLKQGQKRLENDQKKLNSDRGTVERAINRLKENRV